MERRWPNEKWWITWLTFIIEWSKLCDCDSAPMTMVPGTFFTITKPSIWHP